MTTSTSTASMSYRTRLQTQLTNQPQPLFLPFGQGQSEPQSRQTSHYTKTHEPSHSLSRTRSQIHSRGPKSRSISSLPLPALSLNRLTSTSSSQPSNHGVSSTSPIKTTPAASVTSSRPSLARSGSVLSRGLVLTPSRLPATDTVSYFPPFESMGSGQSDVDHENKENKKSDSSTATRDRRQHGKGRSLGSLGALVSWGLSFGPSADQDLTPPVSTDTASTNAGEDGKVVEALVRRVSPGSRKILEPITLRNRTDNNANLPREAIVDSKHFREMMSTSTISETLPNANWLNAFKHRRRMKSEDEVESLMQSRYDGPEDGEDDDVGIVDRLIDAPPRLRTTKRPALHLTLSSLPSWRFPHPSPPVTSLSPDIPPEAFLKIDNPATQSPVRLSSEHAPLTQHDNDELDEIDNDLLPVSSPVSPYQQRSIKSLTHSRTGSSSSLESISSQCRPPKADLLPLAKAQDTLEESKEIGVGAFDLKPHILERSISRVSCDSKETVRPGKGSDCKDNGEVTPRPLTRQ